MARVARRSHIQDAGCDVLAVRRKWEYELAGRIPFDTRCGEQVADAQFRRGRGRRLFK